MSIITTVVNPVDDSEVTLATGLVKRILFKDASAAQKKYDTTHNASIILAAQGEDDVFVNLSLKIKEGQDPQIRYAEGKKGSETWHTLNAGDEVKIQMKDVNKVGDKTYYQTSVSRIKVTKRNENAGSQNEAPKSNVGQSSYKKRDTTGMETGHALNGALELVRGGSVVDDEVELAKLVHQITVDLKAEVAKEKGVDVSDYDVGASVGHAVLNACRNFQGGQIDKDELIAEAKRVLTIAEEVTKFIKGEVKEETKSVKPRTKKEVKKENHKEDTEEHLPEPPMDFDDQDIPF